MTINTNLLSEIMVYYSTQVLLLIHHKSIKNIFLMPSVKNLFCEKFDTAVVKSQLTSDFSYGKFFYETVTQTLMCICQSKAVKKNYNVINGSK